MKARLIDEALVAFGKRGFEAVGVTEVAGAAGVTIGSLYHHFGSKLGLYSAVRGDVERRALDRMEGAAAMRDPDDRTGLAAVLLVGFDYLVTSGYGRLLAEPRPADAGEHTTDPIVEFFRQTADVRGAPVGALLLAAWRQALESASDGDAAGPDRASVRDALAIVLGTDGPP